MIRLTIPPIESDDLDAVRTVLESGILVQGARVMEFEQAVARHIGVDHAVAVSNCTAALHLSLLALDVRPGDLVLVTAYSWPATANVIELCGAQPVFVDIRPDTFNIDPIRLEEEIKRLMSVTETARRVKAIIPVHAFGQMADMPAIMDLADRYGIPVIEDAACALGALIAGRQAGTWGRMGCFSFHPRKAITTGEGGMVVTNDVGLANRLRCLRNHGLDPEATTPDFIAPGFNYRLTEFQAAMGFTQMHKLERVIGARRDKAGIYDKLLSGTEIRPPDGAANSMPVYQSYVVSLPSTAATRRASVICRLKERGVETTIGTWHMPLARYFRTRYGYRDGDFPVTDRVFAASLTLPLHEQLNADLQQSVVHHLVEAIHEVS